MAQSVYSGRGLTRENKRLTECLRHSSELLSEANAELRKATRARAEFMANMSHEFRTPLNVIIGFAELMLDEVSGEINDEQRRNLNDILSSGRRLLHLLNVMLEGNDDGQENTCR